MTKEQIMNRILDILRTGSAIELHIERGKLVIVKISRKAEKTEFQVKTE